MYIINSVVFVADARRKILFCVPHLKNVRNIIGSHEQNKEMNELRKLIMMNVLKETRTHWIKKKTSASFRQVNQTPRCRGTEGLRFLSFTWHI